jgi:hypothetical protein
MKPQYITVGGTPVIVPLDNNCGVFNVTVRTTAGQTVEGTLEDPKNPDTAPTAPAAQVWATLPAAPLGATWFVLTNPIRQLRITGPGQATVLQQGN